jgi:hypothetical protein
MLADRRGIRLLSVNSHQLVASSRNQYRERERVLLSEQQWPYAERERVVSEVEDIDEQ